MRAVAMVVVVETIQLRAIAGGNGAAVDDSSGGYTDQLARIYVEMSQETRERAEELGSADAEEAAVLWDAALGGGGRGKEERRGSSGGRDNG